MNGRYILNAAGQPERCDDLLVWARWLETADDARVVARDRVSEAVRVSTVFLGLDHQFGHGEPLLWETMIFGGPQDGYQDRYTSRADALAGHAVALAKAQGVA